MHGSVSKIIDALSTRKRRRSFKAPRVPTGGHAPRASRSLAELDDKAAERLEELRAFRSKRPRAAGLGRSGQRTETERVTAAQRHLPVSA